jgi:hypothetical protein
MRGSYLLPRCKLILSLGFLPKIFLRPLALTDFA